MARENNVVLVGKVSAPRIRPKEVEGAELFKVSFTLTTLRANGRADTPRINVYDLTAEKADKLYSQLVHSPFAMVRGMITTRKKPKEMICPICGEKTTVNVLVTEIAAFDVPAILKDEKDALKFKQISNSVQVMGEVCSGVSKLNDNCTGYQICLERRYVIKEQNGIKKDYPWVKSFDENAVRDFEHLHPHSLVFINGSFQTKETLNIIKCRTPGCAGEAKYPNSAGEIVTRNVEYLHNCFSEPKSLHRQKLGLTLGA